MNKSIIITFLAALIFAACTSIPKSYIIKGVVPNDSYNNKMVYMLNAGNKTRVDSALVANRKFTFTGSVDTAVLRRLVLDRLSTNFILENGKISVGMANQGKAQGTPLNDEMRKYLTEFYDYRVAFFQKYEEMKKNQQTNTETTRQFNEIYTNKTDSLNEIFFNANKNNALGTFVLWNWLGSLKFEKFDSLYMEASDIVRNFNPFTEHIENEKRLKQTAEGTPFIDFTIENGNRDGSKASLSDYVGKGKYVLVDFWASWCGPCIAEIPVLLEVYNKYKSDKFEVLGVAVWDKREESLKSIEKHNIPWQQIIDAGDIPTKLYGINGIPHIILFAPDGKIVARDLRGDGLKAKVAEVMQ